MYLCCRLNPVKFQFHFRDEVDSVITNHEKVVQETKVEKVRSSATKPVSPVTQVR